MESMQTGGLCGGGSLVSIRIELANASVIEWSGEAPGFHPVELVRNEAAFALCETPFDLLRALCASVSTLNCDGAGFIREAVGERVMAIGSIDQVLSVTVAVDNSQAGEGWESGSSTYLMG